jgi:hypothetical protein
MLTCGSIPSALFSVLFEGGLLSVQATGGPANGGSAVMGVSVTLQMESGGVTVAISEAVLLVASCFYLTPPIHALLGGPPPPPGVLMSSGYRLIIFVLLSFGTVV